MSFFGSIDHFSVGGSIKVPSSLFPLHRGSGGCAGGGGGGSLVGFGSLFHGGGGGGGLVGFGGLFCGGGGGGGGGGVDLLESNPVTIKSINCDFLNFKYPRNSNLLAIDLKVFNLSIFI